MRFTQSVLPRDFMVHSTSLFFKRKLLYKSFRSIN
nr:MAG TPA: hypothetical protein [Caudoviricetes sp.]